MPGRERLQELHRVAGERFCLLGVAGEEQQASERPERVSLAAAIAQGPPVRERVPERVDRGLELRGHVALVGLRLEQVGAELGRSAVGEPQRPSVVRRRLAVGAGGRRLLGRARRPAQHRVTVSRRFGMVGEGGEVAAALGERRQRLTVKRDPATRRDRILDREPRELVPERDVRALSVEHAGGEAIVELAEVRPTQLLEEPQLGGSRDDRNRLEQTPRGRR